MTVSSKTRNKYNTGIHPVKARGRWYVYAWRGGPLIHRTDGPVRPIIDQEMIAKAFAVREQSEKGPTLRSLIKAYQASPEFTGLSKSTKRDYLRGIDKILDEFGDVELDMFEDKRMRRKILNWRDKFQDTPRTADKLVGLLSTILNYGVSGGDLDKNVSAGIGKLHSVNKADQIWEDHHWHAVFTANIPDQVMRGIELGRLTGLRLSDLMLVSWDHVDLEAGLIAITTQKRKGDATIPIWPSLRRWLEALPHRKGPLLLNTRGKAWTPSGFESTWQKSKPEGFDRTLHDLRGSFVTMLCIQGFTDSEIADIIGWTTQRVAAIRKRYVDRTRVTKERAKRGSFGFDEASDFKADILKKFE